VRGNGGVKRGPVRGRRKHSFHSSQSWKKMQGERGENRETLYSRSGPFSSQLRPTRPSRLGRTAFSIASANPRTAYLSPSPILILLSTSESNPLSSPTSSRPKTPTAACSASSRPDPRSPSIVRSTSFSPGWAANAARIAGDVAT